MYDQDFALAAVSTFDERWIFSGSKDCCVRIWNPRTSTCDTILYGHKNSVIRVAADPTGESFATCSGDMKMRLWRYEEIAMVAN